MVHIEKNKPYSEKNDQNSEGGGDRRAETTSGIRTSGWLRRGWRGQGDGLDKGKGLVKKEQGQTTLSPAG